jgi:phosphatidylserine decarboxylase
MIGRDMGIDRAGWPFILAAAALAVVLGWWLGRWWAAPIVVLAGFFLFFFRDPDRRTPTGPDLIVSPADGRVMIVGPPGPGAPPGHWQQISIFLSPVDVHVNRAPLEAVVTRVDYHPGRFLPAYREEAGQFNEWTEVWFEHDGATVVCRQIVGILARRIVTRLDVGQRVARGERFGIMKFGSRIDLFLPATARVTAKVGDKVVGGESTLAILVPVPTPTSVVSGP